MTGILDTPPAPLAEQFPDSRYHGPAVPPKGCYVNLAGWGRCPAPTGWMGPLDVCRRDIGTIGYRAEAGGPVVCEGCRGGALERKK